MPEISRFYGIVIMMFHGDHAPPHFHARYGEHEASVLIGTNLLVEGRLPARAARLVRMWARAHQAELAADWGAVEQGVQPTPIPPLE
jgi:hypothetical protein